MTNKKLNAYREVAQRMLVENATKPINANWLRVNPYGGVQQTEEGAFVEVMLWVPNDAVEAKSEP